MFLELINLVRPVSIGPGIMRSGTDGIRSRLVFDRLRVRERR